MKLRPKEVTEAGSFVDKGMINLEGIERLKKTGIGEIYTEFKLR